MNIVDRFLSYVKYDTQSDEQTNLNPSTPGQMKFAKVLKEELEKMGLSEISLDENGYLMATLPAKCLPWASLPIWTHRPICPVAM